MKTIKYISTLLLLGVFMVSCQAVHINSDYDKTTDFSGYKTYAFYKQGIDKVAISDLDKKRIMRSIEEEMNTKGFIKSENPDLLVNISTKEREQVNVNQFNGGWGFGGFGFGGFGWNPMFWGGGMNSVSTFAEGTLLIDLIDANKKELVWQGEGVGHLTQNTNKKDENIKGFVTRIMSQYPPVLVKK